MRRRNFLAALSSMPFLTWDNSLRDMSENVEKMTGTEKMPVLFMGHGNPMNAIEENSYTRGWREMVHDIPKPRAILIISAHWETTGGTKVYAGEKPKMIYDMYGFPENLYQVDYPAPGDPELARSISEEISQIAPTHQWGLDHGAWSVLIKMFPDASIPCFQLSLNRTRNLQWHYELGKELAFLRKKGV
jgi:4,5-DOPA dioxygenase extradiol